MSLATERESVNRLARNDYFFHSFSVIFNAVQRSIRMVGLSVMLGLEVLRYLRYDFELFEVDMDFGCLVQTVVAGMVLE